MNYNKDLAQHLKYTEEISDAEFEKAPCAALFGKTRYEISVAYKTKDGKLFPVLGKVTKGPYPGTVVVPFFFNPAASTTLPNNALCNAIIKHFATPSGSEYKFVIAEVGKTCSKEIFERIVISDVEKTILKK